jgi:hypothetical protein
MSPVAIAFSIAIPAAFAAGVIFHKYVISEAAAIKQHVTDAETRIRGDFSSLLKKAGADVAQVASKV